MLFGVPTPIEPSQPLKIEVHRVRGSALFRASRLGRHKLGVQRVRQAHNDFVLHVEKIGERLVEAFGPKMTAEFGVDELHIDAHAASAALDAAFQHIAELQLTADLLQIDGLALVGERGVAPDHERARMRERSVVRLSVTPSTKCSCSGSPPRFANGNTTIERRGGADFSGGGAGLGFAAATAPISSE